jgi:hypothetical protein
MLDLFKELFGETVAEKLFVVPTIESEKEDCENEESKKTD